MLVTTYGEGRHHHVNTRYQTSQHWSEAAAIYSDRCVCAAAGRRKTVSCEELAKLSHAGPRLQHCSLQQSIEFVQKQLINITVTTGLILLRPEFCQSLFLLTHVVSHTDIFHFANSEHCLLL